MLPQEEAPWRASSFQGKTSRIVGEGLEIARPGRCRSSSERGLARASPKRGRLHSFVTRLVRADESRTGPPAKLVGVLREWKLRPTMYHDRIDRNRNPSVAAQHPERRVRGEYRIGLLARLQREFVPEERLLGRPQYPRSPAAGPGRNARRASPRGALAAERAGRGTRRRARVDQPDSQAQLGHHVHQVGDHAGGRGRHAGDRLLVEIEPDQVEDTILRADVRRLHSLEEVGLRVGVAIRLRDRYDRLERLCVGDSN